MQNITKSCNLSFHCKMDARRGTLYYDIIVRDRLNVEVHRYDIDAPQLPAFVESLPDRCKIVGMDQTQSQLRDFMLLAKAKNFRYIEMFRPGVTQEMAKTCSFFSIGFSQERDYERTLAVLTDIRNLTKRVILNYGINIFHFNQLLQDLQKTAKPTGSLRIANFTRGNTDETVISYAVREIYRNLANCSFREVILRLPAPLPSQSLFKLTEQAPVIADHLTLVWCEVTLETPVRCVLKGGIIVYAVSMPHYKAWKQAMKIRFTLFRRGAGPFEKLCREVRCLLDSFLFNL